MKVNGQWVPCVRNSFYSFLPIHLKLYMCYGHGLKICMWFGYNSWIIFVIFPQFELSHFFGHFSEWIEGTLCAQLLLQLNTVADIVIMLCRYACGWDILLRLIFVTFFYNLNLVIFWTFLHLESD